jgi:putative flippase GtrA
MASILSNRSFLFLINGLVATAVNYAMLVILIEYVGLRYTGVAALLSAIVGISASFLGNRFFVFRSKAPIMMELVRFKIVYAGTAVFQALCMALWSDLLSLNYSLGFGLITAICVFLSYFCNRSFVFR